MHWVRTVAVDRGCHRVAANWRAHQCAPDAPPHTCVCGLFRSQTGRQSHHRLQATLRPVSRLGFAQGFCSICV